MRLNTGLPVEHCLDALEQALNRGRYAVLCAAPGAGKSTVVPPSLLDAPFLRGGKILMLEPRRIAARSTAKRIAHLLGEIPGKRVGYRTRFETVAGKETKIEVITEGILTRMIQNDPALEGVELLIFDEFHERSIHADLGLALALDSCSALRDDLRILVMSATLDASRVSALLDNAPVISSEGRLHDVQTFYRPPERGARLEKEVCRAVLHALNHEPGDILVFLPGEYEIRTAIRELDSLLPDAKEQNLLILPLYGSLPPQEQDRALAETPPPLRKIIFSTPVAETSITVNGVRIVIDSGLMRVPRFSPKTAMNKLETVRVSLASAEQRRGRAGRTAPGVCFRLWSPAEERGFAPFNTPEIMEADLAPLALELAKWGVSPEQADSLKWLDPPPHAKLEQAFALLRELGALEEGSARLTFHGEKILECPLHPRLAHMVLTAREKRLGGLAGALAAILSERDFLRAAPHSDIRERLAILNREERNGGSAGVDHAALQRVKTVFRQLTKDSFSSADMDRCGELLASAYPDRIARARRPNSGEYTLSNGTGAKLNPADNMVTREFLCAPQVEGTGTLPTVYLSAPFSQEEIEEHLAHLVTEKIELEWDAVSRSLNAAKVRRLGSIVLSKKSIPASSDQIPQRQRAAAFLEALKKESFDAFPWSANERSLMSRVSFLHRVLGDEWPDLSPERLLSAPEEWLAPFLSPKNTSMESLRGDVLRNAVENIVDYRQRLALDTLAPERIEVPSGSKIRVNYETEPPRLSVRLQELFGMTESPRVAGGRVAVVMDILSPAMRTVQVTSDLAGFWKESYFMVRKDMRGRYPKHDWPEDPLQATPHRGCTKKSLGL